MDIGSTAGQEAEGAAGLGLLMVIVLVTLVTSFVCSICEAALYAVSQAKVEQLAESGSAGGRRLRRLRQDVGQPIAAILTLNTIANTVGATLAGWVAAGMFDSLGVGIFSAAFTLGILYVSEIIPKTLGVVYANNLAPYVATILQCMIWILRPLVWACQLVTRLVQKREGEVSRMSEEDLLAMARLGQRIGSLRADEARWVQNALKLDRQRVADILTPRTVVASMPKDTPVSLASQMMNDWSYSRVPATEEGDLDRIAGIVLGRDVHDAVGANRGDQPVAEIMRRPTFVPEAMKVADLLAKFLGERQHLFIVADEYGGTAGVVTLEDALESLLGSEIVDEFDQDADLQRVARRKAAEKLQATDQDSRQDGGAPG